MCIFFLQGVRAEGPLQPYLHIKEGAELSCNVTAMMFWRVDSGLRFYGKNLRLKASSGGEAVRKAGVRLDY